LRGADRVRVREPVGGFVTPPRCRASYREDADRRQDDGGNCQRRVSPQLSRLLQRIASEGPVHATVRSGASSLLRENRAATTYRRRRSPPRHRGRTSGAPAGRDCDREAAVEECEQGAQGERGEHAVQGDAQVEERIGPSWTAARTTVITATAMNTAMARPRKKARRSTGWPGRAPVAPRPRRPRSGRSQGRWQLQRGGAG